MQIWVGVVPIPISRIGPEAAVVDRNLQQVHHLVDVAVALLWHRAEELSITLDHHLVPRACHVKRPWTTARTVAVFDQADRAGLAARRSNVRRDEFGRELEVHARDLHAVVAGLRARQWLREIHLRLGEEVIPVMLVVTSGTCLSEEVIPVMLVITNGTCLPEEVIPVMLVITNGTCLSEEVIPRMLVITNGSCLVCCLATQL